MTGQPTTQLNNQHEARERCPKEWSAKNFSPRSGSDDNSNIMLMATSNTEYRSNRITISIPRAVLPQPVQSFKIPGGTPTTGFSQDQPP
jgi:hypothetical protein